MLWRHAAVAALLAIPSTACGSGGGGDGSGGSAGAAGVGGEAGDGAAGASSEYAPPGELGPYPVGVQTRVFVDETRDAPFTPPEGDDRTLVTEIWYPAAESTRNQAGTPFKSYFGPDADTFFPLVAQALSIPLDEATVLAEEPTPSVRDAEIAEAGPFPVVVFSHGNSGLRFQSTYLTEHLASHGYIVVSPDHTGNAIVTLIPGYDPILYDPNSIADVNGRVADVSFLVDVLDELNATDPEGLLEGKIDLENIALTGHSFGGTTTLLAMAADDRFDVGVPLTAGLGGDIAMDVDRPTQHFLATEDQTVGTAGIEEQYAASPEPKMILRIEGAGHFSFSIGCEVAPEAPFWNGDGCGTAQRLLSPMETFTYPDHRDTWAVNNFYETAFLGYYVRGITEYGPDLESEPFRDYVEIDRAGVP